MSFERRKTNISLSWFCCNCGTRVNAIRNDEGYYKARCSTCGSCSVRKVMGRRHDTIEIYAPKDKVQMNVGD